MLVRRLEPCDRYVLLPATDMAGESLFFFLFYRREHLVEGLKMLSYLPAVMQMQVLIKPTYEGLTLVQKITQCDESIIPAVLQVLSHTIRLSVLECMLVEFPGFREKIPILHKSVDCPSFFKALILSLTPADRIKAITSCDQNGKTILHHCVDSKRRLALHNAINCNASLSIALDLLPPRDRFAAVRLMDNNGVSVLEAAASKVNLDNLLHILKSLPCNKRLAALRSTNMTGKSVLNHCINKFNEDVLFHIDSTPVPPSVYSMGIFLYDHQQFIALCTLAALAALLLYNVLPAVAFEPLYSAEGRLKNSFFALPKNPINDFIETLTQMKPEY